MNVLTKSQEIDLAAREEYNAHFKSHLHVISAKYSDASGYKVVMVCADESEAYRIVATMAFVGSYMDPRVEKVGYLP